MRTLTRYVLFELLKTFTFTLTGLTMTMILIGVVRQAMDQGLPPGAVLRLIPYILPDALRMSVPVTLLLTATTVYSRMSGFNEIVAIKALGISPMTFFWPILVLGVLLSFVTVWLNDLSGSWGRAGAQRVIVDAVEEIAYGMLRTQRRYSSPQFAINVKRVDGRKLVRPTLSLGGQGSSTKMTVTAEHAELHADHRQNVLKIILHNATMEVELGDKVYRGHFDVHEEEIPLNDASRAGETASNPSCLPLRQIPEEITKQAAAIELFKEELATQAACRMLTGDLDDLAGNRWAPLKIRSQIMWTHLCRLRTEPYRRWAAGFSCLCFILVGAPMAVRLRNREFLTSFFLCFAPILVVYYPLFAYGIDGAKNGTIPPFSVWTGNLILALWGMWLFRKVLRY